ncbi:prokaryotic phospholipase A2-domain-containing protein [Microdochium trichocladiopsis]|uniref:Prokaryotic phospholipase A2-domain-containing protein n=1 Tax=Microdochium trichocladiopsis TaxID=1682393 RepID=A0A9P8XVY7_9PEZI|nr:prokaryotic phospholipase A2-domain-containing protein [Microdochium trichocladiopsis]KAH7016130.1 prokaryotic phospholipase A2-domain-containing protein [Microdochium trichocladiopsis]
MAETRKESNDVGLRNIDPILADSQGLSTNARRLPVKHDARDPATLDWTTDDCMLSPDNPLGFPFVPACHRHDFGYNNYHKQNRFTTAGRLRIDNKFKTDLYYQCNSVTLKSLCRALAEVYYAAVRAFGGLDPSRRDAGPPDKEAEDDVGPCDDMAAAHGPDDSLQGQGVKYAVGPESTDGPQE